MEIEKALLTLRDMLLAMKATGADGFEGLCATCVAQRSGLTMRLARSGLQLGRDASSPSSSAFAISLECKRYSDPLGLDDLIGKVALAVHELEDDIDLWILGATSELGDIQEQRLSKELANRGMTLLTLDWCPRPLPPLAVLLAATSYAVLEWSDANPSGIDRGLLETCLNSVETHPAFAAANSSLGASLAPAEIGLGALRRQASEWLRARLSDSGLSRRTFNQRIGPGSASAQAVQRNDPSAALSVALAAALSRPAVVAILGGEGSGKTWLVAQWWAAEPVAPIIVLVAGRRAELLNPANPVETIAKLLAQQGDRWDDAAVEGWRRRLARWRLPTPGSTLRFVIVLDGLNERTAFPWADVLSGLSAEAARLGGVVVITSRTEFWRRNVLPRLGGVETIDVPIVDFTDAELDRLLVERGVAPGDLSTDVRTFIRNPRVCAVALDVLERLNRTPQELSIDRLLMEYWRSRIEDRGDLVAHSVADFHKLLRSHASAWLQVPGRTFERDDWAIHSGAAKREGLAVVKDDLTEIEEGRFLSATPGFPDLYQFQPNALPFALGLLLVEELRKPGSDPDVVLDSILGPVLAFDRIGSVLSASMCLACIDDTFPETARWAILRAWFGLQNVEAAAFQSMAANVPTRPQTFLDYAGLPDGGLGMFRDDSSLTGLLVCHRRHSSVSTALAGTMPRWLGRWSKTSATRIPGIDGEAARAKRSADIEGRLAELGPVEAREFRLLTNEGASATGLLLDRTAAALISGLRQEAFAVGMVAWALARSLDRFARNGGDELAWAVRLNRNDFPEVLAAVHAEVTRLQDVLVASWTRDALATALRLLGDQTSSARADRFNVLKPGGKWRRVSSYCDTNPHDPGAEPGSNIAAGVAAVRRIAAGEVWSSMSTTLADHNLEGGMPALARFDPATLVLKVNEIVGTIGERSGMALRQLAWHLPRLAPLLNDKSLAAMTATLDGLKSGAVQVAVEDRTFVIAQLASALLARLTATRQADLLEGLPVEIPTFQTLHRSLQPLDPALLENRLAAARSVAPRLRRILLAATARGTTLTPHSQVIVLDALFGPDRECVELAGEVVARSEDAELFAALVARHDPAATRPASRDEDHPVDRAMAVSIIRLGRTELLDLVAPRFMGWAVSMIGDVALLSFGRHLGAAIDRLLSDVRSVPPEGGAYTQFAFDDDFDVLVSCMDASKGNDLSDPATFVREANDPEGGARRFSERQRALIQGWIDYRASLAAEGAGTVTDVPSEAALRRYAHGHRVQVASWLDRIMATTDEDTLGRVRNVGLCLSAAHSQFDIGLAADAFRHLRDRRPPTNVLVGSSMVPIYDLCLFSATSGDDIDLVRAEAFEEAMDDARLETLVAAAAAAGADDWLDGYLDVLVASDAPGCIAKALTSASLRGRNAHTERLLAMDWGTGFLGAVSANGRKNYERARWAEHWTAASATAIEAPDFWRFALLAEGVADRRLLSAVDGLFRGSVWRRPFGAEFEERLRAASNKFTTKREGLFCGMAAPAEDIRLLLRDTCA